jgi:hypothetical protein
LQFKSPKFQHHLLALAFRDYDFRPASRSAQRSTLSSEALFSLAAAGAARPLPRLTVTPAGATCNGRDAAPVLFGRAASAAGAVRRLDCLNAKLGRDTNRNYEVAELLRQPLFSACNNNDSTSFDTTNCVTYLIKRLLKARKPGISRRENDYANVEPCDILLEPQTFVCREEHVKGVRTKLQQLAVLDG